MDAGPLIFLALTIAMGWFLLIRPQRRRHAQHMSMVARVSVGDQIVTAGGLYGRVLGVGDENLSVEIAPNTTVRIAKGAIADIVVDSDGTPDAGEPESAEAARS